MHKNETFSNKVFLHRTGGMSPKSFTTINNSVRQFQNIINSAIDALRTNGLDYLADLIDEDWQPKNIVSNLQATFHNFLADTDHPFLREIYWEELENERMINEKGLSRLDKIMHWVGISLDNLGEYPEIRNTILYLIASLPLPIGRETPLENEVMDFFRAIIKIEMRFFESVKNKYQDLPRFLSSEIINKVNIKELRYKNEFSKLFMGHATENVFLDFFHAFTSAQARIMCLSEDTQFLIWLIRTMVQFENKEPNALPYIKKIAEDVILHKTLSYDAVREKSSSALSEAQYFVDFDKVIRNIVNRWELKR